MVTVRTVFMIQCVGNIYKILFITKPTNNKQTYITKEVLALSATQPECGKLILNQ